MVSNLDWRVLETTFVTKMTYNTYQPLLIVNPFAMRLPETIGAYRLIDVS